MRTAAIDLDGVLTRKGSGDYLTRPPDREQIARVRELKARGWRIVVWTSRRPTASAQRATLRWLHRHRVPFDRLVLGKPIFDLHVDDAALPELPAELEPLEDALRRPRKLRNL